MNHATLAEHKRTLQTNPQTLNRRHTSFNTCRMSQGDIHSSTELLNNSGSPSDYLRKLSLLPADPSKGQRVSLLLLEQVGCGIMLNPGRFCIQLMERSGRQVTCEAGSQENCGLSGLCARKPMAYYQQTQSSKMENLPLSWWQ